MADIGPAAGAGPSDLLVDGSDRDDAYGAARVSPGGPRRRRLGPGFWLPLGWIGIVLFSALFGGLLPLDDPNVADPCAKYVAETVDLGLNPGAPPVTYPADYVDDEGVVPAECTADSRPSAKPSATHPAGTDTSARDTLARLVAGARVAMVAGVVTIAVSMLIGGTIGLIAGFHRGKLETGLMALVDILLAFPTLVLALAIVTVLGQSLLNACIAITIVAIPAFARITRANTLTFAEREFVTAARVMGAKNSRIMLREILPNVIFPVMAFGLVAIAIAIVAEGSLAFLSLSVRPPQASWGQMINDGRSALTTGEWWVALTPAFVMFLTVLSFNMLGDKFREIFNVKDTAL